MYYCNYLFRFNLYPGDNLLQINRLTSWFFSCFTSRVCNITTLFYVYRFRFFRLSGTGQEIFTFFAGLIFSVGIGTLLGLLNFNMHKRKYSRGFFYAILCSMLGYTIGAMLGGIHLRSFYWILLFFLLVAISMVFLPFD